MLPRPLRLLWDTSPPGGVVLSSFRSRDPEEGGGPGGRGVGGGQEEEEEEEEDEVRRERWEVEGVYFGDSPRLCPLLASPRFISVRASGRCLSLSPRRGPGASVASRGGVTQDLPAGTCPAPAGASGRLSCGSLALSAYARVCWSLWALCLGPCLPPGFCLAGRGLFPQ